jgi:hypothetical protein
MIAAWIMLIGGSPNEIVAFAVAVAVQDLSFSQYSLVFPQSTG